MKDKLVMKILSDSKWKIPIPMYADKVCEKFSSYNENFLFHLLSKIN